MSDSLQPHETVALQAPVSMGFPRQEYWNELPFPFPGDLPDPGIKPASPALAGRFLTLSYQGSPPNKSEVNYSFLKMHIIYEAPLTYVYAYVFSQVTAG